MKIKKKKENLSVEKEKRRKRGKNAKAKGASYERTLAKKFQKKYGIELKRTPQSGGFAKKSEKADEFRGDIVVVDETKKLLVHIEAKNQKTWSLHKWLEQSREDCPEGKIPLVVFHEYNTSNDYVTLSLDDFFKLVDYSKIVEEK